MKKVFVLTLSVLGINTGTNAQLEPYFDETHYMYGFHNASTQMTIGPIYQEAYAFRGNEALVKRDFYYLMDTSGNEFQKFDSTYTAMRPVKGTHHYSFKTDNSVGYVSSDGKILNEFKVDSMYRWGERDEGFVVFQNGKLGMFIMQYGMTMPTAFECDDFFRTFNWDGNLYFRDSSLFALKRNGKYGIMSMYTGPVVPFEYDQIIQFYDDHYAARKGDKWAVLHKKNGKPLTAFEYDYVFGRYGSPGFIPREHDPFICYKDGKIVFFDVTDLKTVTEVPPSEFNWEAPAYKILEYQKKSGIINPKGEWLQPLSFDWIATTGTATDTQTIPSFVLHANGKTGVWISEGKFLVPMTDVDDITLERMEGKVYYIVKKNDKAAWYNSAFKPITRFDFSYINVSGIDIYVSSNGRTGTMTPEGKVTWDK